MVDQIPEYHLKLLLISCPADFSFRKIRDCGAPVGLEGARFTRTGGVPERGAEKKKFLTKSIWLNNNKLKNIKNVDELVESILEYPSFLGWLDFSYNYIKEIDECILKFKDLKILYFHGNCIEDLDEIFKLRKLKELRTVTFHGNPIANHPRYRRYIVAVLPQVLNIDFTPVVKNEKLNPHPVEAVKILKEEKSKRTNQNS